jgi:hypothetical protein
MMMTETALCRLVDIFDLQVDDIKSKNSTRGISIICPCVIVSARLRWLGGDDMKAIEEDHTFHSSSSSAKRIVRHFFFLRAVRECDHPDLEFKLPLDDELDEIAEGWNSL